MCVHQVLERTPAAVSVYAACAKIQVSGGGLTLQAGEVAPYRLELNAAGQLLRLRAPRDGSLYLGDLQRLFSPKVRAQLTPARRQSLLQALNDAAQTSGALRPR
ncbi:hypothetical protein [Deinococcus multiflagellatus]|uniref:Uncharacterized protein n=1 Tax=Deinococcus multiflagellatus TaxID=1656887 RepID=A0ABW1ZH04_9DEIO|nr:hypothetical protein [Deinococcus multiflagellatus]MBZ9713697.1 hypothetical protein [Deinococcus multiflagellatus]